MESSIDQGQKIHIKCEIFDELLQPPDSNPIESDAIVKIEENGFDDDNVIYEHFPWEQNLIEAKQENHSLPEFDKSVIIKTEIEIEETKLETKFLPSRLNTSNPKCIKAKSNRPKARSTKQKSNTKRFECHLCRFTSKHWHLHRFLVHFRKHTGEKPFSCKCCAKKFSSERMLNFHMKYHPSEIPSKCSFCTRKFATTTEAKKHESDCAVRRKMECYLCKSTFTYKSSLLRHMPQHTGLTTFNCKYCSKGYGRKDYLNIHMKIHTRELQFHCTICELRFVRKADADEHMASCIKKVFKCNLCNYSTISKIYAEDHKQKHVGSDEFKCWHCPAVFLQRSKLVHHVKTHNKKVQFQCPYCRKAYDRWLFMERHRQACSSAPSAPSNDKPH